MNHHPTSSTSTRDPETMDGNAISIEPPTDIEAPAAGRHRAGFCTYAGDVRHLIGVVKGPTTYSNYVQGTDAVYDHETDKTRVEWRHCTEAENAQLRATGTLVEAATR